MDVLKTIAKKIIDVAPALGGALAIPTGGASVAIGAAIKALGLAFGLGEEAKPEDIAQAIAVDPEWAFKARVADQNYKVEMKRLEVDELKTVLGDVQSARAMKVAETQATGRRDTNLYILAWVIMGGFIGLIACMVILQAAFKINLSADPMLSLLVGSLSTNAGMVVGYFFGSSRGSENKTDLLAKAQPIIK